MTTSALAERLPFQRGRDISTGQRWCADQHLPSGDWTAIAVALTGSHQLIRPNLLEALGVAEELGRQRVEGLSPLGAHTVLVHALSSVGTADPVREILEKNSILGLEPAEPGVEWVVDAASGEFAVFSAVVSPGTGVALKHRSRWGQHLHELVRSYLTLWNTAVLVGALQGLREVAVTTVRSSASNQDDPLVLERLGRIDSIAWAAAAAFDGLLEEAAEAFLPEPGALTPALELNIAAIAAAVSNLTLSMQHDLIGPTEPGHDEYLEALTYFLSAIRVVKHSRIQQGIGRALLADDSVLTRDDSPVSVTADRTNA